jgi:hypothetical protein
MIVEIVIKLIIKTNMIDAHIASKQDKSIPSTPKHHNRYSSKICQREESHLRCSSSAEIIVGVVSHVEVAEEVVDVREVVVVGELIVLLSVYRCKPKDGMRKTMAAAQ